MVFMKLLHLFNSHILYNVFMISVYVQYSEWYKPGGVVITGAILSDATTTLFVTMFQTVMHPFVVIHIIQAGLQTDILAAGLLRTNAGTTYWPVFVSRTCTVPSVQPAARTLSLSAKLHTKEPENSE